MDFGEAFDKMQERGGNVDLSNGDRYYSPNAILVLFAASRDTEEHQKEVRDLLYQACDMDVVKRELSFKSYSGKGFEPDLVITKLSSDDRNELKEMYYEHYQKLISISQRYFGGFSDLVRASKDKIVNMGVDDQKDLNAYSLTLSALAMISNHLKEYLEYIWKCNAANDVADRTSEVSERMEEALEEGDFRGAMNMLGEMMRDITSLFHQSREEDSDAED